MRFLLGTVVIILIASTIVAQSNQSISKENQPNRYWDFWADGNDNINSYGVLSLGLTSPVGEKAEYIVHGLLIDVPFIRIDDKTSFSFRGPINLIALFIGHGLDKLLFPNDTSDSHNMGKILFTLPNSSIRYKINKNMFMGYGTETHIFPFKFRDRKTGILTSPQIFIGYTNQTAYPNINILLYTKYNQFIDFERADKSLGYSFGVKASIGMGGYFD